jgi:hypothetical protein
MPYFIYRVTERPIRHLEKLEEHAVYKDASSRAKELRRQMRDDQSSIIKVIFADTELHAEDLLSQVREPAPELGDD